MSISFPLQQKKMQSLSFNLSFSIIWTYSVTYTLTLTHLQVSQTIFSNIERILHTPAYFKLNGDRKAYVMKLNGDRKAYLKSNLLPFTSCLKLNKVRSVDFYATFPIFERNCYVSTEVRS